MVSIINIHTGIKEPTSGYQDCNTSQILIFDGYVNAIEFVYTQVIIRITTILNHIDIATTIPRREGPCMVCKSEWY
jgi:hypothetical protein